MLNVKMLKNHLNNYIKKKTNHENSISKYLSLNIQEKMLPTIEKME